MLLSRRALLFLASFPIAEWQKFRRCLPRASTGIAPSWSITFNACPGFPRTFPWPSAGPSVPRLFLIFVPRKGVSESYISPPRVPPCTKERDEPSPTQTSLSTCCLFLGTVTTTNRINAIETRMNKTPKLLQQPIITSRFASSLPPSLVVSQSLLSTPATSTSNSVSNDAANHRPSTESRALRGCALTNSLRPCTETAIGAPRTLHAVNSAYVGSKWGQGWDGGLNLTQSRTRCLKRLKLSAFITWSRGRGANHSETASHGHWSKSGGRTLDCVCFQRCAPVCILTDEAIMLCFVSPAAPRPTSDINIEMAS